MTRKKLGDLLVESGVLDQVQLAAALGHQRQWGGRLGRIFVEMNFTDEKTITRAVAKQLGISAVVLQGKTIGAEVLGMVPQDLCEKFQLLPFGFIPADRGLETLQIAMSDPTDLQVIDELAFRTGKRIEIAAATDTDVDLAIRHHFYGESVSDQLRAPTLLGAVPFAGREVEFSASLDAEVGAADGVVVGAPLEAVPGEFWELSEADLVGEPGADLDLELVSEPLDMQERLLLNTLDAVGGRDGEVIPSRELVAGLMRLLIRKRLLTEEELIAEFSRK